MPPMHKRASNRYARRLRDSPNLIRNQFKRGAFTKARGVFLVTGVCVFNVDSYRLCCELERELAKRNKKGGASTKRLLLSNLGAGQTVFVAQPALFICCSLRAPSNLYDQTFSLFGTTSLAAGDA